MAPAITLQSLQAVTGRSPQEIQGRGRVQLRQLPLGHPLEGLEASDSVSVGEPLRVLASKL